MVWKKITETISIAKSMLEGLKTNITDEYIAGYYNGIETMLALLEGREPEHILFEEKTGQEKEKPVKRTRTGGKLKKE